MRSHGVIRLGVLATALAAFLFFACAALATMGVARAQQAPGFPGPSASPGAPAPATPQPAASLPPASAGAAASPAPAPSATPAPLPSASPPPAPLAFRVSADKLLYYSDRFIITGTGNVRVHYGSAVITGQRFAMDLKLNRFLVAGHVHLSSPSGSYDGAAFAEFLQFRRAYFIPVSPEPDRWTFIDGSYANHYPGREMPGDTFYLPDMGRTPVFLQSRSAVIRPLHSVTFTPALMVAFGAKLPSPAYVLNFAPNPYFGANSLAGAQLDLPYFFLGGPNQLGALHIRYNGLDRAYLSFEERLVDGKRGYLVFSGNPLTRPDKQYNLNGYLQMGSKTSQQLVMQLFNYQSGLSQPLSSSGFASYQLVHALRQSFLTLTAQQSEGNLLAPNPLGYYGTPDHGIIANHPFSASLGWTGFPHNLDKNYNFFYRLRSGFGYDHDAYGLLVGHSGDVYDTLWDRYVGGTIYTKSYDVGAGVKANLAFDRQITTYSYPHINQASTETLTLSRFFSIHESLVAQVQYANSADIYFPYATLGTVQRSFILSDYFNPSPELSLQLSYQYNHDTPPVLPGIAGLTSRPPSSLLADVKVRLSHSLSVDIARTYFFNFGVQKWSPGFSITFGP